MISFYPGPSKVVPELKGYLGEAYESGILQVNHRSPEFVALMKRTVALLHEKLDIPKQYRIFFTSSATECWEIVGESFLHRTSLHLYNGAFGEKWFQYRKKLMSNALSLPYHFNRLPSLNQLRQFTDIGMLCLTQNETSNATQIRNRRISKLKKMFPNALTCVDATSSMAGQQLDWLAADIWFASVQKCFGLPAGLAVMVCSPRAVELAQSEGQNLHYNSLAFQAEMGEKFQTTYTPNMLNIFLLGKVMEARPPIAEVSKKLENRMVLFNEWLTHHGYQLLVGTARVRSFTLTAVKGKPEKVEAIKKAAKEKGLLLGNGYGIWKPNTFRVANFPAITDAELERLKGFLNAQR